MINKETILDKAIHECMCEMYAKSQPAADWDNIVEEYRQGKIGKDERVYERHYLSSEEFRYILDKYVDAYRLDNKWINDIDLLTSYLKEGGSKDKYIKAETDENGNYHPGYRSYEKVDPLQKHINKIISQNIEVHTHQKAACVIVDDCAKKITDKVLELIDTCKNFYSRNIDEEKFRTSIALGASPTSNKETVVKWWKENYNEDIEIKERNPLLLWEMDYFDDEFEENMEMEYGEDWEKIWEERLEEHKRKEEEKRNKALEALKRLSNEEE